MIRPRALPATLILALLGWALSGPARAEGPWEPWNTPDTGGGVVLSPRLESASGRIHLFWGWTQEATRMVEPEFTYASLSGDRWSTPRPPYFGDNLGRIRRIAVATARQSICAIFQRQLEQSDNAFEVLFTLSNDGGWSYARRPGVADSYNHEGTTGTAVAVAGVSGRRPGFALGWLTEGNQVRVGVIDPKANSDRPRAHTVGTHASSAVRLAMAGEEGGGFLAAWFDGSALKAVRLKPLVGDPEEVASVLQGQVGMNFALTDWKGRRPILVARAAPEARGRGSALKAFRYEEKAWVPVPLQAAEGGDPPAPRRLEADQDERGELHVVSYPGDGKAILYQGSAGGRWTPPEPALTLNPDLGVTGFDVVAHEGYVYVVAAQGPRLLMSRRRIPQ